MHGQHRSYPREDISNIFLQPLSLPALLSPVQFHAITDLQGLKLYHLKPVLNMKFKYKFKRFRCEKVRLKSENLHPWIYCIPY